MLGCCRHPHGCGQAPAGASAWTYDLDGNRKSQTTAGVTTYNRHNDADQLCATATTPNPACGNDRGECVQVIFVPSTVVITTIEPEGGSFCIRD